jgi:hypothetical protein
VSRHPREGIVATWITIVIRFDIDGETRALLLYLAIRMDTRGQVCIGTRENIAHLFGVAERRIAERFQRARAAGLIDRVSGGHPGAPTVWEATLPSIEVAA